MVQPTSLRKIITICGSSRFRKEMEKAAIALTKEGNTIFSIICFDRTRTDELSKDYDDNLKDHLIDSHFHKIMLSNAIYVVNIGGYIGKHTQAEIDFAKNFGIEVIYSETK